MTGSEALRRVFASLFMPRSPIPATEGTRIYFSSPSGGTSSDHHDHHGHDHEDHEGHDHDEHGHGHGEHECDGHDHHDHEGHDHDDHAGHGHGHHNHAHDLRGASRRNLIIALTLISTYMLAEVVGGILSGSLALIADAGHMLTDALALGMALAAMWMAERSATAERTFGYERTEVLAAMLNTIALWLIAGWIFFEAYHRAFTEEVHVDGIPVLVVGTGGLLISIAAAWVLRRSSEHSMNVEGAFQHVDAYKLCNDIEDVEGVTLIHDVHIWTITSGSEAFTAHVLVDPSYEGGNEVLRAKIQDIAHNQYGIGHVTIQLEHTASTCREAHHVDHLLHTSRPSAS